MPSVVDRVEEINGALVSDPIDLAYVYDSTPKLKWNNGPTSREEKQKIESDSGELSSSVYNQESVKRLLQKYSWIYEENVGLFRHVPSGNCVEPCKVVAKANLCEQKRREADPDHFSEEHLVALFEEEIIFSRIRSRTKFSKEVRNSFTCSLRSELEEISTARAKRKAHDKKLKDETAGSTLSRRLQTIRNKRSAESIQQNVDNEIDEDTFMADADENDTPGDYAQPKKKRAIALADTQPLTSAAKASAKTNMNTNSEVDEDALMTNLDENGESGDYVQPKKTRANTSAKTNMSTTKPSKQQNRHKGPIKNDSFVAAIKTLPRFTNMKKKEEFLPSESISDLVELTFNAMKKPPKTSEKKRLLKTHISIDENDPTSIILNARGRKDLVDTFLKKVSKRCKMITTTENIHTILSDPNSLEVVVKMDLNKDSNVKLLTGKKEQPGVWLELKSQDGQFYDIFGSCAEKGVVLTKVGKISVEDSKSVTNAISRLQKSKTAQTNMAPFTFCLHRNAQWKNIKGNPDIRKRNGTIISRMKNVTTKAIAKKTGRTKALTAATATDIALKNIYHQEAPVASNESNPIPKKQTAYNHFIRKIKAATKIEFDGLEYAVKTQQVNKLLWRQHKIFHGDDCNENCGCVKNLGSLSEDVVCTLCPKQSNNFTPVGFLANFCPKFFDRVKKQYTQESNMKILARLVYMWDYHRKQLIYGEKCKNDCGCGGAWELVFLPACKKFDKEEVMGDSLPTKPVAKESTSAESTKNDEVFSITFTPSKETLGFFCSITKNFGCVIKSFDSNGIAKRKNQKIQTGTIVEAFSSHPDTKTAVLSHSNLKQVYDSFKKSGSKLKIFFRNDKESCEFVNCKNDWTDTGAWCGEIVSGWAGGSAKSGDQNSNENVIPNIPQKPVKANHPHTTGTRDKVQSKIRAPKRSQLAMPRENNSSTFLQKAGISIPRKNQENTNPPAAIQQQNGVSKASPNIPSSSNSYYTKQSNAPDSEGRSLGENSSIGNQSLFSDTSQQQINNTQKEERTDIESSRHDKQNKPGNGSHFVSAHSEPSKKHQILPEESKPDHQDDSCSIEFDEILKRCLSEVPDGRTERWSKIVELMKSKGLQTTVNECKSRLQVFMKARYTDNNNFPDRKSQPTEQQQHVEQSQPDITSMHSSPGSDIDEEFGRCLVEIPDGTQSRWSKIVDLMKSKGHHVTVNACKSRWKTVKKQRRNEKEEVNGSNSIISAVGTTNQSLQPYNDRTPAAMFRTNEPNPSMVGFPETSHTTKRLPPILKTGGKEKGKKSVTFSRTVFMQHAHNKLSFQAPIKEDEGIAPNKSSTSTPMLGLGRQLRKTKEEDITVNEQQKVQRTPAKAANESASNLNQEITASNTRLEQETSTISEVTDVNQADFSTSTTFDRDEERGQDELVGIAIKGHWIELVSYLRNRIPSNDRITEALKMVKEEKIKIASSDKALKRALATNQIVLKIFLNTFDQLQIASQLNNHQLNYYMHHGWKTIARDFHEKAEWMQRFQEEHSESNASKFINGNISLPNGFSMIHVAVNLFDVRIAKKLLKVGANPLNESELCGSSIDLSKRMIELASNENKREEVHKQELILEQLCPHKPVNVEDIKTPGLL